MKKINEAVKTYLKGIENYPSQHKLKGGLAFLYAAKMRQYSKAFKYYQKASEQDHENIDYMIGLAKSNYLIGKRKESAEMIQKILDRTDSESEIKKLEKIRSEIKKYRWRPSF